MTRKRTKETVVTPWFIRLGIYVAVGLVGLVTVAMGFAQPEQVEAWIGQVGGLSAVIGALFAGTNLTRDEKVPAPKPEPEPAKPTNLLNQLREAVAENRG